MSKALGVFLMSLMGVLLATAPTPSAPPWMNEYSGEGDLSGEDLLLAPDGGYFILSRLTQAYEPVTRSDACVLRVSELGEEIWRRCFGGALEEKPGAMIWESPQSLLLSMASNSFGHGDMNAYLVRIREDGSELWSATYGGPKDEYPREILAMEDGGYALVGSLVDPDDFIADASAPGYGGLEGRGSLFVLRLDENMEERWSRTYDNGENVLAASAVATPDGSILILGTVMDYPESDDNDLLLMKVDASGTERWTARWDEERVTGYDLLPLPGGGVLIGAGTGPAGVQASRVDPLLVRVSADGEEIWRKMQDHPDAIDFAGQLALGPGSDLFTIGGAVGVPYFTLDSHQEKVSRGSIPSSCHTLHGELISHPGGGYAATGTLVCFPDNSKVYLARFPSGSSPEDEP